MIIFSSADMEASRGAIHKGMRETPQVQVKSRYEKGPVRKAAGQARLQVFETVKKYPFYAIAAAILIGFALGAVSDVRRSKRA